MTEPEPSNEPSRRPWVFLLLFVVSLAPLLFLNLDEASQLASALALPFAVLLAALPPSIPPSGRPLPWRRLLLIGAVVFALFGGAGVTWAIWQNTKDLAVSFPTDGKPHEPWKDGNYTLLPIPGNPPKRGRLALAVSLHNANETGDCEDTATLEFVPVLDGREREPVRARPGQEVDLSLAGTVNEAKAKVILHYEAGLTNCAVALQIDKAVLHD